MSQEIWDEGRRELELQGNGEQGTEREMRAGAGSALSGGNIKQHCEMLPRVAGCSRRPPPCLPCQLNFGASKGTAGQSIHMDCVMYPSCCAWRRGKVEGHRQSSVLQSKKRMVLFAESGGTTRGTP
jgi:hypothetical protein